MAAGIEGVSNIEGSESQTLGQLPQSQPSQGSSGGASSHLNGQQFGGIASKMGRAAEIDAAGGGPEDPVGDIAALGSMFLK